MNKITRLTIAALCGSMMLSVSGCNSLDQMPTNKFTDDSFWSSADRAQSVLNMAYSQMYSHDKIWQDESLSDNMYELKDRIFAALALYKDPEKWERLVKRIMNIDFSWNVSAQNYIEMYKNLC